MKSKIPKIHHFWLKLSRDRRSTRGYLTIVINFRTWCRKKQQSDVSRQKYRPLYSTEERREYFPFFFPPPFFPFLFAISSIEWDAINVESLAIDFTNKNLSFVLPPILVSPVLFTSRSALFARARPVRACTCTCTLRRHFCVSITETKSGNRHIATDFNYTSRSLY